jgi:membrane associated rhomboid family serine protease
MIPFKDDNPTQTFPFVTVALIVVNSLIYLLLFLQQKLSPLDSIYIVKSYGAIPHFLLTFKTVQPIHPALTIFTSMFIHGGPLHLVTNMLYLWIFGDNIEDRLGHARFLVFYLLCGIAAAYSHAIANYYSLTPMIGASGAVSGVLGAYLLLYPRARVHTLIFIVFFIQVIRLPAVIVIGLWIVIQFINGIVNQGIAGQGGVAWFAHIGGFIFGLLLLMVFVKGKRKFHFFQ